MNVGITEHIWEMGRYFPTGHRANCEPVTDAISCSVAAFCSLSNCICPILTRNIEQIGELCTYRPTWIPGRCVLNASLMALEHITFRISLCVGGGGWRQTLSESRDVEITVHLCFIVQSLSMRLKYTFYMQSMVAEYREY
jgi:hypothetical protein